MPFMKKLDAISYCRKVSKAINCLSAWKNEIASIQNNVLLVDLLFHGPWMVIVSKGRKKRLRAPESARKYLRAPKSDKQHQEALSYE